MRIKSLKLINFRNYNSINFSPGNKINIFIGKNAQGKTNLLESIGFILKGKSFRTNTDRELINFGKEQAYVSASVETWGLDKLHEIKFSKQGKKTIRINENEISSLKELKDEGALVIFSPTDLNMIKYAPSERRKFIDYLISQLTPLYEYNLNKYKKILAQRNKLLKINYYNSQKNLLDVYSMQLALAGTVLIRERLKYIKKINEIASVEYLKITGGKENLKTVYLSTMPFSKDEEELKNNFYNKLKETLEEDMEKRTTTIGPHRDDLSFYIDNKDSKIYGSQGQQRSIVLALKLSEVKLIKEVRGFYPILLLDDVFSELDEDRKNYFINSFKDIQSFITMTDSIKLDKNLDANFYKIENSNIYNY